jgi:23S rRNA pseudouridine2605 synthase
VIRLMARKDSMKERLQKLIAAAGVTSRRHAEEMMLAGKVTVNGVIITRLGTKCDPEVDHIKINGQSINAKLDQKKNIYILLNKPKGYLSSLSDPDNRPLVTKLLPPSTPRVHPVGRLDFNTEGLLLLTNDGALTKILTTAAEHVPKVYEVKIQGIPTENALLRLSRGILIDDRRTAPAIIKPLNEIAESGNRWFEITLYEGRNNQIRKMFDLIGHSVLKLRRVRIGHLTSQNLALGEHRFLKPEEVAPFFKGQTTTAKALPTVSNQLPAALLKKGPKRRNRG